MDTTIVRENIMSKELSITNIWDQLIADTPEIEDLEIAGRNRHRDECFKIALHLRGEPKTEKEFYIFMGEYIRQLISPEVDDVLSQYENKELTDKQISALYRTIRKLTRGV